jgi:LmbE family N-acetylglucosaminyl deacetylase
MTVETLAQALAVLETGRGRAARRRARWRGTARILVTGAHPDDEMSAMLAALVWRDGAHVTYACATRGEGGQNAIGREAGRLLGALRTREMEEAARRLGIDLVWLSHEPGAAPADFGFARSPEATLAHWGRAHVVARLVDAIRGAAPDIVWTCFRDVDGQHGHHRAIARATVEAVARAADPAYAPPGVVPTPWTVAKHYSPAWSGSGASYDDAQPPPAPSVVYDAGGRDPVTGLAYLQIGEVSRAAHASQAMGVWRYGDAPAPYPLERIDRRLRERDLFDGVARDFSALATEAAGPAVAVLQAADEVLAAIATSDAEVPDFAALRVALRHLDMARGVLAADAPLRLRHRIDAHLAALTAAIGGDPDRAPGVAGRAPPPVAPHLSVRIEPRALVVPISPGAAIAVEPVRVEATLFVVARDDAATRDAVGIDLRLPDGWRRAGGVAQVAPAPGEGRRLALDLEVPPGSPAGDAAPLDIAIAIDGAPALHVESFSHRHVGDGFVAAPAVLRVRRVVVATPRGARIAYCGDGPDGTDGVLRQLGLDTTTIGLPALADAALDGVDTLILGIGVLRRLPARDIALTRLHGWVRAGGHLVTLHHKPGDGWDPARSAPGFVAIGTPSIRWRVCDPAAPVRMLVPDHPLLMEPNRIDATDWEGWRHERCVHAAMRWDPAYVPLLAMADPGMPDISGALLSGVFGHGRHTHVTLALHRQYADLVPGALRLLANLVQPARFMVRAADCRGDGPRL